MSCRLHSGRYWAFWGLWSNTRKCTSATPKPFVQRLCVCVYITQLSLQKITFHIDFGWNSFL
uniref:Uncharacterized protein n=1 Tax=Anguilla anguilla TaxID=7936 RepID=A0A0E9SHQ0_ANGAN